MTLLIQVRTLVPAWMLSVLCATSLGLAQDEEQEAPAELPPVVEAPFEEGSQVQAVEALPRAKDGRWIDWVAGTEPPAKLAEPLAAATRAYQGGRIGLAVERAMDTLRLEPDYPPALLLGGVSLYRLRRYGDAIELYERLLHHVPGEIARTRQLGHCLHSLGRSEEALRHYGRLLEVRPDDLRSLRSRGVVRLRTGDIEGAMADLDAVLVKAPKDAEALYWRASALYDDEHEGALAAAKLARDGDPFRARTWFLLAQAAGEAGEPGLAEEARSRHAELAAVEAALRPLEDRLLRDPADLEALEASAQLYLRGANLDRSRRTYLRLLRLAEQAKQPEIAARAQRCLTSLASLER